MPRQARLDAPGTLHHVIVRGIDKRRIVNDPQDRENFVSRMGELATETKTAIYAWALLDNHAHILLRSGPQGLPKYMRRFLTGYAITYNRRHKRYGHVFQNRYKSIVCDEDSYFRELIRYIHLNPLRAKLVNAVSSLEKYPWCGHAVVVGKIRHKWQDRDFVLSWFGEKKREAKGAYRKYIEEGATQGKRPELVGGGLIRSVGGWSEVRSLRKRKKKVLTDERILGSGEFVERIIEEANQRLKDQFSADKSLHRATKLIEEVCKKENVSVQELRMGSRRGNIPWVRSQIALRLVKDLGIPMAEVARQLGVTTSGICKAIERSKIQK